MESSPGPHKRFVFVTHLNDLGSLVALCYHSRAPHHARCVPCECGGGRGKSAHTGPSGDPHMKRWSKSRRDRHNNTHHNSLWPHSAYTCCRQPGVCCLPANSHGPPCGFVRRAAMSGRRSQAGSDGSRCACPCGSLLGRGIHGCSTVAHRLRMGTRVTIPWATTRPCG